jgi:peptidoglycan/LPS O-acetylase OafA/YrhL
MKSSGTGNSTGAGHAIETFPCEDRTARIPFGFSGFTNSSGTMTAKAARLSISPSLSMLLDLTRIVLSLTVATGHWTQHFFQDSWPDLSRLGVVAVGVFFVLSGFTIRMIYPARENFSFASYVAERWSRILSVSLPALLLTAILDAVSWHASPAYYVGNWPGILDHPVLRLAVNLFGLSQVWNQDVAPLSNNPFWSISYELGFYLVYGLWLSGRRLLAVVCLVLLGPQIALLLPVWLLGVLVYEVGCARAPARVSVSILAVSGVLMTAIVALFGERTRRALSALSGIDLHRVSLTLVIGALVFFSAFVILAPLCNRLATRPQANLLAVARWLGNLTFPIYLFHFPMFVFLGALEIYDRHSAWQRTLAFGLVLALIAVGAPATDYFKVWLRSALLRVFGAGARPVPQRLALGSRGEQV